MGALAWQYYFYVEASGDISSEDGRRMLEELGRSCDMLKVCGSYPEPIEL